MLRRLLPLILIAGLAACGGDEGEGAGEEGCWIEDPNEFSFTHYTDACFPPLSQEPGPDYPREKFCVPGPRGGDRLWEGIEVELRGYLPKDCETEAWLFTRSWDPIGERLSVSLSVDCTCPEGTIVL